MRSNDHAGGGPPRSPAARPGDGRSSRGRDPLPTRVDDLPDLPPSYARALEAGLDALGLVLPAATRAAIDGHVRLLLAWNQAINLTAIRDPAEVARLHVLDSLAGVRVLRALEVRRLLDLGSGGGFPGLPLALALPAQAALVDSVGKKVRFLEVACRALAPKSVAPLAGRAETLAADPRHREAWPAVTARAVAPLAELIELAFPLLATGGALVAWKRGDLDDELAAASRALAALGGGRVEVTEAGIAALPGHRLVVARKTGPTEPGWPRDPAARRRRPW